MGVETSVIRVPEKGENLPDSNLVAIWQVALIGSGCELPVFRRGCGGAKRYERRALVKTVLFRGEV
ncbi:MAG TPA: hypothetical protein VIJ79_12305 [Acidobacteriaceae bacterium]